MNCCKTHQSPLNFLNLVWSHFKRSCVPLLKRLWPTRMLCVERRNRPSSKGGTVISCNNFEVWSQLKKSLLASWVAIRVQFLANVLNMTTPTLTTGSNLHPKCVHRLLLNLHPCPCHICLCWNTSAPLWPNVDCRWSLPQVWLLNATFCV